MTSDIRLKKLESAPNNPNSDSGVATTTRVSSSALTSSPEGTVLSISVEKYPPNSVE
jgi:hypothetical protein